MKTLMVKVVPITLALILLATADAVLAPQAVHAVAAALVRDVDNPARHPFTTSCTVIGGSEPFGSLAGCFTNPVPDGEEVVIDTISFLVANSQCNSSLGNIGNMGVQLAYFSGGVVTNVALNPVSLAGVGPLVPGGSTGCYLGQQAVKLRVDPESEINTTLVNAEFIEAENGFGGTVTFSGYYVTLP